MARRYDLVVCDIDGCLSPETNRPMDLPNLLKVAEYNRLAKTVGDRPELTICTGRPQPFAEAMSKFLDAMDVPCVAEHGVWVYYPALNTYLMDPAITPEHKRAVREAADWLEARFEPEGVTQQPGKTVSISLYHPDAAVLRTFEPEVKAEFRRRGWPMRVSMTWCYINCDLEHVSKAAGIRRMVSMTGVPRDRLAGIGDTMSDLAIRQEVAFFACPANAAEGLKAEADYVASREEAEGVVEILEMLKDGSSPA